MNKLLLNKEKQEKSNLNDLGTDNDFILQNLDEGYARYKILFDENSKPYDFVYLSVNKAYEKITNLKSEDIIGKELSEVCNDYEKKILEGFKNTILNEQSYTFEYHSIKHDKYYKTLAFPVNKVSFVTILSEITDTVKIKIRNNHLIKMLNAIRKVKSLIVKEKEQDGLLNSTCEILANVLGYSKVWILLFNYNNKVEQLYCSDKCMIKDNQHSIELPPCLQKVIETREQEICFESSTKCNNCMFEGNLRDQTHIIVPILFNNTFYGVITIAFPTKYEFNIEESSLFKEVAEELAYALFNIDVQKDLELARERIRLFYKEIESQNSKLKSVNQALEYKNKKLEKANKRALESDRLKSVFLANISHEIRTPLNGILGFSQLLTKTTSTPDVMREYADLISNCGDNLLQIINNIMDISKIETSQLKISYSECNISGILNDVYNSNKNHIKDPGKLLFEINEKDIISDKKNRCDGKKVNQILNILIDNAIKFTAEGFIKIGCKQQDDNNLLFYVADSGIGIKKENYNLIFERFRQVDESNSREYGGAGLGLAVAKGLVEIMNGEIWFESKLVTGTTFYFKIPYQSNYATEQINKNMDIDKINLIDWSNKKILIVEDDIYSLEYLSEVLSETKVNIEVAKTGKEALLKAKENNDLDLILMDIQLPIMSGDKVTTLIREFNKDIPIIAQTAHAMVNDKENYIKAGCTDYISKPIGVNELFSILCKYI
ncbi:MAG: response regulator [Bacteroidales bacterium]|nr:response regulator [Bacteroidales bacterium]